MKPQTNPIAKALNNVKDQPTAKKPQLIMTKKPLKIWGVNPNRVS